MNKRIKICIFAVLIFALIGLLSCAPEGYVPSIKLTSSPESSDIQNNDAKPLIVEEQADFVPVESTVGPSVSPVTEDIAVPVKNEEPKTESGEENDSDADETVLTPEIKEPEVIPGLILDVPLPEANDYLLIKDAKIITMAGNTIERGDILIKGTKIQKIGKNIKTPKDAEIIEAEGLTALPGLIMESAGGFSEDEDLPFYEFNPLYRAADGIILNDNGIDSWIELGVTTVIKSPNNMLGSQAVAVKTYGKTLNDVLVSSYCAQNIEINRELNSTERIKVAAAIREKLIETQAYIKRKGSGDAELDALSKLLKRKVPLIIGARSKPDFEMLNQIAKEFNLTVVNFRITYTVRTGNEETYRKLSIDAARMMGIDNRVGSIEKGKDADIVLCNGDEIVNNVHNNVKPCMVIINGAVVYKSE